MQIANQPRTEVREQGQGSLGVDTQKSWACYAPCMTQGVEARNMTVS